MNGITKSKTRLAIVVLVVMLIGVIAIPLIGKKTVTHAQSPLPFTPTNISGEFFYNTNNSGMFDNTQKEAFTQTFQAINFNPDPSIQTCNPATAVNENTRPFTDVYPARYHGGPCKTVVAQNSAKTLQAGVSTLNTFEAGFKANLTVQAAGTMISTITSDDGFIFSVGAVNGQQPIGDPTNPMINPPSSSPLKSYKVIAANNQPSAPNTLTIETIFPAPGTYPMELDYTECCGGTLTLVMSTPHTLWGVDSSERISTLYNGVTKIYNGVPDFWGRYIGTGTPKNHLDMNAQEKTFAQGKGLSILPIYADFTSSVQKKTDGEAYAKKAIIAAQQILGISPGVAIFLNIEPNALPTDLFLEGWYEEFNTTFTYTYNNNTFTYQPSYYRVGYYGASNVTSTTAFDKAFCKAASTEPQISTNSFIWAPYPTSLHRVGKSNAPLYQPYTPACANQTVAWQFAVQSTTSPKPPNVDTDEALLSLPLWHL